MRILVTNDDGIQAEGLRHLVDFAKTIGDVIVAAPKTQQSAQSQAINLKTPIEVLPVQYEGAVEAYSIDSTPADCVRIALRGLYIECDIIFSGINCGWNLGADINYSATCGAIFEASFQSKKAVAFSASPEGLATAPRYLRNAWNFLCGNKLLDYNDIYNINFPDRAKGIRVTRQGGHFYEDDFVKNEDGLYVVKGINVYQNQNNPELDTDSVMSGYISVTPVSMDRTAKVYNGTKHFQIGF